MAYFQAEFDMVQKIFDPGITVSVVAHQYGVAAIS